MNAFRISSNHGHGKRKLKKKATSSIIGIANANRTISNETFHRQIYVFHQIRFESKGDGNLYWFFELCAIRFEYGVQGRSCQRNCNGINPFRFPRSFSIVNHNEWLAINVEDMLSSKLIHFEADQSMERTFHILLSIHRSNETMEKLWSN